MADNTRSLIELLKEIDSELMGCDSTIDGYYCSPLQRRIQAAIAAMGDASTRKDEAQQESRHRDADTKSPASDQHRGYSDAVQVCPDCDIADCHHIRDLTKKVNASGYSVVDQLMNLKTGINSPYQHGWDDALSEAIKRIRATEPVMVDEAYRHAVRLFQSVAPQCKPLEDTLGVLTQLDNCIAGLRNLKKEETYEYPKGYGPGDPMSSYPNSKNMTECLEKNIWHEATDTEFDAGFNEAKRQALQLVKHYPINRKQAEQDIWNEIFDRMRQRAAAGKFGEGLNSWTDKLTIAILKHVGI